MKLWITNLDSKKKGNKNYISRKKFKIFGILVICKIGQSEEFAILTWNQCSQKTIKSEKKKIYFTKKKIELLETCFQDFCWHFLSICLKICQFYEFKNLENWAKIDFTRLFFFAKLTDFSKISLKNSENCKMAKICKISQKKGVNYITKKYDIFFWIFWTIQTDKQTFLFCIWI